MTLRCPCGGGLTIKFSALKTKNALVVECKAARVPETKRYSFRSDSDLRGEIESLLGEACEQVVHLADRGLKGRDHVGAEVGIVGVPFRIAREKRQLADQIFHVVEDEGEAAVEFLEPLSVRKRLLAECFGERTCRLRSDRTIWAAR